MTILLKLNISPRLSEAGVRVGEDCCLFNAMEVVLHSSGNDIRNLGRREWSCYFGSID